jgi:hypothetical protein
MKLRSKARKNVCEILIRLGQRALYSMLLGIKRCVVSQMFTEVGDNILPLYTEHDNIKTLGLSILLYLLLARQQVIK